MVVNLAEILEAIGGDLSGAADADLAIDGISTDTRTIGKGDAFFALPGKNFDAHDFLGEAVKRGARVLIISNAKKVSADVKKTAAIVEVPDVLTAYGDLARFYRQKFRIPAVAITGSSGKTTVKELTAHVLSAKFKTLKNQGTENNLVGVPKTLLKLDSKHEAMVIEMGTNQPGEIDRLTSIVGPQIGILTQIGYSHLLGLGSIEGVREEKLGLVRHMDRGGQLLVNGEDPQLANVKSGSQKVTRVGLSPETGDLYAERIWCHDQGTSFHVNGDLYETSLMGRHNVLNVLFAIGAAQAMGMDSATIRKALAAFKPVAGRLCPRTIEGIHFLDDSYNANPGSMEAALRTLKSFKMREKRIVVIGDMLELGDKAEEMHRQTGALIAEFLFDAVILAGPLSRHTADEAVKLGFSADRIQTVKDSEEAGKALRKIAAAGDRVLVKGSRGMKMEKVFECFTYSSTR